MLQEDYDHMCSLDKAKQKQQNTLLLLWRLWGCTGRYKWRIYIYNVGHWYPKPETYDGVDKCSSGWDLWTVENTEHSKHNQTEEK